MTCVGGADWEDARAEAEAEDANDEEVEGFCWCCRCFSGGGAVADREGAFAENCPD